ncbi:GNAT family N-acetyltransferase [Microbacterium sp. P04]|uniref:GNAT family N-acetyltransferase n=1 Tax=Microbacterium sp. P04 TaxID=3366947 RepID=UPI0037469481
MEPVAWVAPAQLREEMATGNYRPEWSWIAERDGRMIGRALWWGREDAGRPATLDCLWVADPADHPEEVGAALVRAGLESFGPGPALEFKVDVDVDWPSDPAAVHAVRWRERAARAGGFRLTTERVSFVRTDTDPRPGRSLRLSFAPAADDVFRSMFARVAARSLDAHTLDMVAREGLDALAEDDLHFYLSLPGDRDAWQIATLRDGSTVGFIIPTRTAYDASISYLGVVPEHRGKGYVHDLLAEMVHVHHENGQHRIVGTTDRANAPMGAAFTRAGFTVSRVRIVHEQ